MPFRIGAVYRYSNRKQNEVPEAVVDGLPNFFYETYSSRETSKVFFQKGIHNIATVRLQDGSTRIPAIIISSSPHKARTDMTPWEDEFDPDFGRIKYYGDNKHSDTSASEAPGNKLLLEQFFYHSSPDQESRRLHGVPLIFFKRVDVDGRKKGNLLFQGFGIIESIELITQFDPKLKSPYFTNYVYEMCVLSLAKENEEFSWEWINARRNPELTTEQADKYAPVSWKRWVKEGSASLYKIRRNISNTKIITDNEQQPDKGSKEEQILNSIYEYYSDKRHVFELLALRVTQEIFEESGA